MRSSNGIADAPAGDTVGLGHAIDGDGAFAHAWDCGDRNMLGTIVDNVLVDLIGNGQCIPLLAEARDLPQLRARENFARRVVRGIDDNRFRMVVKRGL